MGKDDQILSYPIGITNHVENTRSRYSKINSLLVRALPKSATTAASSSSASCSTSPDEMSLLKPMEPSLMLIEEITSSASTSVTAAGQNQWNSSVTTGDFMISDCIPLEYNKLIVKSEKEIEIFECDNMN